MSAERSSDWSCGSLSGIMVVRRERVPDAILVVMMLAVGDVFCVAHGHLFTTVPGQFNSLPEVICDGSFVTSLSK